MIEAIQAGEMTFTKWLETQSPLWVIYALVIIAIIQLGRFLMARLPALFDKHCQMLDTATNSIRESADAIRSVNEHVNANGDRMEKGHRSVADAAVPMAKAILHITPVDKREVVKEHLDEVVSILRRSVREG